MLKMKKFLVISVFALSLSLSACASPTTSTVDTNKDSVKASDVKEVSKYKLPLKYTTNLQTTDTKDTLFEVKEDGTFNYIEYTTVDGNTKQETKTLKLTDENIKSLLSLLKELDLDKLAEKDEKIPENSPQTLEIRLLENISILVSDKEKIFDYNSRLINHSEEYKAAFNKIKEKLENFKPKAEETTKEDSKDQVTTSYTYALPLKIMINSECQLGDKTTYEVKEDGNYSYSVDESLETKEMKTKTLSKEQLDALKAVINEINIAKLAEKDEKIPEGGFMTMECRAIENYQLKVNDKEQIFDMNGRKLSHTEEYGTALKKLKDKLDELKK